VTNPDGPPSLAMWGCAMATAQSSGLDLHLFSNEAASIKREYLLVVSEAPTDVRKSRGRERERERERDLKLAHP